MLFIIESSFAGIRLLQGPTGAAFHESFHHVVERRIGVRSGLWGDAPRLVYVVLYDIDPATKEGFVYLGGHALETHELNMRSITRLGYDGKRFRATKAWDEFVRPVVERAGNRQRAASRATIGESDREGLTYR
jgi:hypothetical protein